MAASSHPRPRGFTLVELMITLSIAGILAAIGMPALGSMLARSHRQSAEGALQESLMHARETAIVRDVRVIVCPSSNGRDCATTSDWQNGWLVAKDADHDDRPDGVPLAVLDGMPPQMRILASRGRLRIVFQPNGSAGGSNVQFTLCHLGDTQEGSAVIVSNSGRVRTADAPPDRLKACLSGNA